MVPYPPGCLSGGRHAGRCATNAKEAVECHLEGILMDGERIPQPSADIKLGAGQLVGIVSVDLPALQRAVAQPIPGRIPQFPLAHAYAAR